MSLYRAYDVLETRLDDEAAAAGAAPTGDDGLSEFSSLFGVAGAFWREHGDALRRAPSRGSAALVTRVSAPPRPSSSGRSSPPSSRTLRGST